jgi:hypothetical protein
VNQVRSRVRTLRAHLSSPADVWLALRIATWALIIPVLKTAMPLSRLVRLMYRPARGGGRRVEREERIARFIDWVHRPFVRADKGCLQRSLLAYRFLSEANAEPRLHVGVQQRDGTVHGHAWISVDGRPVGDSEVSVNSFTSVATFGWGGALTRHATCEERDTSAA